MKHINIGIVAHVDAGKTTLTEALLYKTGSIRHLGRVDAKDTFLDTNEQERERGITIFSKQARLRMGSLDITLVDTPGHVDFSAEAESVLQVLDYCILIISASDGIKGHTLTLWSLLEEYDIPTFIFVNKMDQPGASADAVMAELKDRLSDACLDVSHAYIDRDGQDVERGPDRPFSFTDEDYENIAMCDEGLMEEYLESMKPIDDERIAGLIRERKLFPVFFGSALKLEGVDGLMAGLSSYTLEDEYATDFAARVFKITRDTAGNRLTHIKILGGNLNNKDLIGEEKVQQIRIYSGDKFEAVASAGAGQIVAVTGLNETRMGMGLGALRGTNLPLMEPVLNYKVSADDGTDTAVLLKDLRILEEEDPQLIISYEEDVKEIRAAVMGEVQLEVLKRTVRDRFHVSIAFDTGTVVYKETVAEAVEGVGHYEPLRHYAEAHILISPMPRGSGITYDSICSEDILDRNWQRLILTHLKERMHKGVLTGSVITDVKFTILTGRAHLKHTEGGDFRQATYRAVRQGLMSTRSILLEPYFFYRIELPSDSVGRAMTDLERMKGKPQAPMIEGDRAVLTGTAPAVCIRNYAKDLAAYTKGEGTISLSLAGYEECHNADEVIESMGYIPEADLRNSPDSVFCAHGAGFVVPWNEVRDYMHVESPDISIYLKDAGDIDGAGSDELAGSSGDDADDLDGQFNGLPRGRRARRLEKAGGSGPVSLGTDEIDAILNKTFYSNSGTSARAAAEKRKGVGAEKSKVVSTGGYVKDPYENYKYKPVPKKDKYLVVDGYNIVHAWSELKELAAINLDGARDRLIDIMSNLKGAIDDEIILVFDAYKVKGRTASEQKIGNVKVVFTEEDETADSYIERFAAENGRKYDVTVATSDNLEGGLARGSSCRLISARELERYARDRVQELTGNYTAANREGKIYLSDFMK